MLLGLDFLGGPKYGDVILREMPAGWMFRCFTSTFGDALPLVQQIAKLGRVPTIGLNLMWKDSHNFSTKDFPAIQAEAKRFRGVIAKYPNIEWLISGATEHNLNSHEARDLGTKVLNVLPSGCKYVNNPQEGKGGFVEGVINETHGSDAHPPKIGGEFGFSCDGSDCFDFDIQALKQRFANAKYFMFWCCQFNGRMKADDSTPRPQRKAWPVSQLIDATIYLKNDPGICALPKNWLIKPKADQHSVPPEPRALKPVVIAPVRVDRLELIADNGQVVAVSSKPEPFADGRWRYYFDQYGYQISEKAQRIHGKPTVSMRVGKKIVGTCNMAFRYGASR